ncbi:TIGR02234 family membrane protein [Streptomyces microflavus]|uniref:TIGR02234 family membrane protein n=1 Tax=Streptomyces microflavus TaxID=1919 RepID=UPI00341AC13D
MDDVSAVPVPQPRARTAASGAAPDALSGSAPDATPGSVSDVPSGSASDSTGSRRSLAAGLLLGAVGATVVLLASGQVWAEGRAATGGGALPLTADGQDVTGAPAALAIVGLAALVAVFAVRGAGRRVVAALLALSGLGAALSAWAGASDSTALDEEAARTTGDAAATIDALTHTAWPYVTAAGGLLILLAGVLALRFGSRWPTMSGRYERDGTPRPRKAPRAAPDPDRPEELWKALDRGEDPTREG